MPHIKSEARLGFFVVILTEKIRTGEMRAFSTEVHPNCIINKQWFKSITHLQLQNIYYGISNIYRFSIACKSAVGGKVPNPAPTLYE